jgi:TatD DNase family protein
MIRPFINIHTHTVPEKETIAIVDAAMGSYPNGSLVSAGIHPWYINEYDEYTIFHTLNSKAQLPEVIAIGECGLDKNAESEMEVQEHFFREQVRIAERVNKPLIIHCVKAFNRLIGIKKECKTTVPFIIHGFNSNEAIARQLLDHGMFLSFGKALLNEGSNAQKIIRDIHPSSFFLETDNANISISSIFEKAAALRGVTLEELKEQMIANFKSVFNYD